MFITPIDFLCVARLLCADVGEDLNRWRSVTVIRGRVQEGGREEGDMSTQKHILRRKKYATRASGTLCPS